MLQLFVVMLLIQLNLFPCLKDVLELQTIQQWENKSPLSFQSYHLTMYTAKEARYSVHIHKGTDCENMDSSSIIFRKNETPLHGIRPQLHHNVYVEFSRARLDIHTL